MGEDKKYYWMRFQSDFFKSLRIKRLRQLAGGDTYTIIYLKMQLLSLADAGKLYYKHLMSSFAEEIALDIDEQDDDVAITINYLLNSGLMIQEGDEYFLPYAADNVGSDSAAALRARRYRANLTDEQKEAERERARIGMQKSREKNKENVTNDVTNGVTNVEIEKEIEKDKENTSLYRDVVEHLNKMTGKSFKTSSEKTKKLIHARLKEGFTLEDFKTVIDIKCAEWLHDEKMETYLRPETLFGTKFEGYLNQKGGKNDRRGEKGLESGMASEVPWSVFRGDFD